MRMPRSKNRAFESLSVKRSLEFILLTLNLESHAMCFFFFNKNKSPSALEIYGLLFIKAKFISFVVIGLK